MQGSLQIGEQVPHDARLWVAPIDLRKVLLGNDALSQVAKIEIERGNPRRLQAATADEDRKTKNDLAKKAVEHPTTLRTMDFGDTILSVEAQEEIRKLVAYQPVGAFSKKLTATEQRYSTIEREPLGVLRALDHWAIYMWGHPIVAHTDHKPIAAPMRSKGGASGPLGITNRQETSLGRVAPLNVEIRYAEGSKNSAADALSGIPQDTLHEKKEGAKEECTSLPVPTRGQHQRQKTRPDKVHYELLEQQKADSAIKEIAAYFKKRPKMTATERIPYAPWDANLDIVKGAAVWTKKDKAMPYIPETMRPKILNAMHDAPLAGHKGGRNYTPESGILAPNAQGCTQICKRMHFVPRI